METKVFDFIESLSGSYEERYFAAAEAFTIGYEEAESLWFLGFLKSSQGRVFKKLLQDIDVLPEKQLENGVFI